jgi:hypothetical protein
LPEDLESLFTPAFLSYLRAPTGVLAEVWRPAVPVRIYAARLDLDVPISNASYCRDAIGGDGGTAEVVDVGDLDHSASVELVG